MWQKQKPLLLPWTAGEDGSNSVGEKPVESAARARGLHHAVERRSSRKEDGFVGDAAEDAIGELEQLERSRCCLLELKLQQVSSRNRRAAAGQATRTETAR